MSDHYKKNKSDEKLILPTLCWLQKKTYIPNELKRSGDIVYHLV